MNVKNETSNSKVMILIYQNAICTSRKKFDFIFFLSTTKYNKTKNQQILKQNSDRGPKGHDSYINNINLVYEKIPHTPSLSNGNGMLRLM